ncbi:hypothetical protein FA13DRAFT_1634010 [Coprinellus micaceus]|uniref:Uncharacterized protein n=1 Tax=Coprinellus micaceus TaxID=71717 RepID=A0A4Y7T0Y5_COPMI|nr:hypothetical protein FA13DRAFT_1637206 [Coprinellus micaceus]TEB27826.1 hypothetical protein FA13DRAFT_1634010 [Coprinellus micaceus]
MVIKDVCTRWNLTHAMLARALLLSDAIDDWVHGNKEYRSLGLRPKEWEGLRVMCRILEVCPLSPCTSCFGTQVFSILV